jgi:hypothetical protein
MLRAWHVLVLGYRDHDALQAVIERAETAHASSNSLYFDYASGTYVTTETLAPWRFKMFLVLLRQYKNTPDMII